jgi:hypothetical protein
MKTKKVVRKYLFVDRKVQGALIARVIFYWFTCLLTLTLMILCWRITTGPARLFYTHFDDMWFHFGPAVIGSFILLPMVVYDIIRLSNRFVGPLIRLRRSLRALAEGKEVSPLYFREGDFWKEFAIEFNTIAEQMQKLRKSATTEDAANEEYADEEPVLA